MSNDLPDFKERGSSEIEHFLNWQIKVTASKLAQARHPDTANRIRWQYDCLQTILGKVKREAA